MKKYLPVIFFILTLIVVFAIKYNHINELKKDNFNSYSKSKITPPIKGTPGLKDDPYAASRYRYEMVTGGKTDVDPIEARAKAIIELKEKEKNSSLNKNNTIGTWTNLGPGNIGGRIRSIVIRPSNSNHILLGAVAGGVWKSTDGGSTWNPKFDSESQMAVASMVNDGDVVYAGTGEGWGNVDAVYGGGIYKSTDFGDTWTLLSSTSGVSAVNFRNVLVLQKDPSGNIYAVTKAYNSKHGLGSFSTNGGLYRSTNGGTSWSKIFSSDFSTNYFNPSDVLPISSTTILMATRENSGTLGGIFRTTDSGSSWTKITSGLPTTTYRRIAFAPDPNNAAIAFAVFHSTDYSTGGDAGLKGIYKTIDSGLNWSALNKPGNLTSTSSRSYLNTQGWYNNAIAVDPNNSNNIFVAGVDMMKSTNGGTTWSQVTYWHSFYGSPVVHADHHAIVFDPNNPNTIFNGNDGGIYKTTNSGTSWTNLNNGLEITQFYGGAVGATGNVFYGGTQDNGHLKYNGTGTSWTEEVGGDGGYAAVNPTKSNYAYEEYVYLDMSRTTNGGASWSTVTTGLTDADNGNVCLFIAPFSINENNGSVLIAGSDNVWITSNDASSWTASSNTLVTNEKVSAVTVTGSSSPYLGFAGTTNGRVFKCTSLNPASGIDTWTDITPDSSLNTYVRRITVDPNDNQKLYACYSGFRGVTPYQHIKFSPDQGTTWNDITGDLPDVPVHSLVVDRNDERKLYIGTELGVFETTNRGINWIRKSTGMPDYVPVDELVWQSGTNKLFAFTHGRSVFVTESALPVELISFTASVNKSEVTLNWQTATEVNNYGFEVEVQSSSRGEGVTLSGVEGWNKIGFVKGSGNSNSAKNYTFTDKPLNGKSFRYRLKQIDTDGTFKYHKEIEVELNDFNYELSQNYPNPFNPTTKINYTISVDADVTIDVYSVTGELAKTLVNKSQTAGNYSAEFNGTGLASGTYIYRLTATDNFGKVFTSSKKMLLIK